MYQYLYGPVPSRRLGISLGVDLFPRKICSFACVYCECGKNDRLTSERGEYVPVDSVLDELRDYMSKNPAPDYITLSGSGEPTMHTGIGRFIRTVKLEFKDVRVAVLTNSSLLNLTEVRNDLMEADLVLPSLDAATEKAFRTIDRPAPGLDLNEIISGIADFTKEFHAASGDKKVYLEVFIIEGINTDRENIDNLRNAILRIGPDQVQLNTLDRPATENWVKAASKDVLESFREKLHLPNVEIVSKYQNRNEIKTYRKDAEAAIVDTIGRRPSTINDIQEITGLHIHELSKYLDILEKEKKIQAVIRAGGDNRGIFYETVKP